MATLNVLQANYDNNNNNMDAIVIATPHHFL